MNNIHKWCFCTFYLSVVLVSDSCRFLEHSCLLESPKLVLFYTSKVKAHTWRKAMTTDNKLKSFTMYLQKLNVHGSRKRWFSFCSICSIIVLEYIAKILNTSMELVVKVDIFINKKSGIFPFNFCNWNIEKKSYAGLS